MLTTKQRFEQEVYIARAMTELQKSVTSSGLAKYFSFKFKETYIDFNSGDDVISFGVDVIFNFGNIERLHTITLGWNEEDDTGFEYGEDCELMDIHPGNLFRIIYLDLALEGLNDKYLA